MTVKFVERENPWKRVLGGGGAEAFVVLSAFAE